MRARRRNFTSKLRRYQGGWSQFIYYIIVLILSIALSPKPPKPRAAALDDFDVPVAEEDRPIPVLFGTWRITGANVLWYGALRVTKIKKSGLFSSTVVGYKYHLGLHLGFCHGPVDEFSKLEVADKEAWTGSITDNDAFGVDLPALFGGTKREGGLLLDIDVCMGADDQAVNPYLSLVQDAPVPAYRGIFGLVSKTGTANNPGDILNFIFGVRQIGYIGTNPYVKPWAVTAKRILMGWHTDVFYPEKAEVDLPDGGTGMNPAHIIFECLTDPEWGMGADPILEIDDANFREAADTLFDEGFGLNMLWNQATSIEDFLGIVLDHVAGIIGFDHTTGKYVIKLIRGDYDPTALPIFDESNLSEIVSLERRSWGETVNELTLSYTNPDTGKGTAIIVQDLGNLRSQGVRIPEKADFTGIRDNTLMKRVAGRELLARSTPLARIEFKALRAFWQYGPGTVVRVRWAAHNLPLTVFRVLGTKGGTLQSGYISVNAVEDIYALPGIEYVSAEPTPALPTGPDNPDDGEDQSGSVIGQLSAPPSTGIMDGDRYLVGPGATGAWAGHEGQIAEADIDDDTWRFTEPSPGAIIFDEGSGSHVTVDNYGNVGPAPWTPAVPGLEERLAPALATDFLPLYDGTGYKKIKGTGFTPAIPPLTEDTTPDLEADFVVTYDASAAGYKKVKGNKIGGGSPLTTKGDIYTHDASTNQRLPVGSDGLVLRARSGEATGLAWESFAPPVGEPASGARVFRDTNQSIPNSALTPIDWTQESYDTDSYHSPSTNQSALVVDLDGKYTCGCTLKWDSNVTGTRAVYVVVNGVTATRRAASLVPASAGVIHAVVDSLDLEAGDYVEFYAFQDSGGARDVVALEEVTSAFIARVGVTAAQLAMRGATWIRNAPISTPVDPVDVRIPVAGVIQSVTVMTDGGVGSCVVDIWKDTFANFPPTVADTITASAKPTISSGVKYEDSTLTGWTTTVNAGDVLRFNLDTNSVFKRVSVQLFIRETQ